MRLAVEEDLQPVLDLAEKAVGVVHDVPFLGAQAADLLQPGDGLERGRVADLGILAAVQQLQELDDELDVANAASARLDLDLGGPGRDGALLDPPLERLDLGDLGRAEIAAIDERLDRLEKGLAQGEVARDRTALDERLALPGPAAGHVVAQRGVQRPRQCPLFAVGPQPHVDAIGDPQRGVVGQQPDDVAPHPGKELGVGHDLGALGLAVFVVEEDQIDVGAVVELLRRPAFPAPARRSEPADPRAVIGTPNRASARTRASRTAASTQASARSERSWVITSSGKPRTMSL